MTSPNRESLRTCVGCRRAAPSATLVRLAVREGALTFWGSGRARPTGRGASLHPDAACLRAAIKQGAFVRAFFKKGSTGVSGRVGNQAEADLLQQLTAAAAALRDRNRESP